MAYYGITSEAQLIDYQTIRQGCQQYVDALSYFSEAGQQIIDAGNTCSKDAMSVDGASMQSIIVEIGELIMQIETEYSSYANQVYSDAVTVYNQQVAELNEYNRRVAEEQAAAQNNG